MLTDRFRPDASLLPLLPAEERAKYEAADDLAPVVEALESGWAKDKEARDGR